MRGAYVLLLQLIVFGSLSACGGDDKCAGAYSGHWVGTTITDSVDLDASCHFEYTGATGCRTTGVYNEPLGDQGSFQVSITSSTGNSCLPAGQYECTYSASSTTLTYDCGAGAFSYRR